ncbi:MAG: hypothetical protein QM778_11840 [Myxococcales bacterium]
MVKDRIGLVFERFNGKAWWITGGDQGDIVMEELEAFATFRGTELHRVALNMQQLLEAVGSTTLRPRHDASRPYDVEVVNEWLSRNGLKEQYRDRNALMKAAKQHFKRN